MPVKMNEDASESDWLEDEAGCRHAAYLMSNQSQLWTDLAKTGPVTGTSSTGWVVISELASFRE